MLGWGGLELWVVCSSLFMGWVWEWAWKVLQFQMGWHSGCVLLGCTHPTQLASLHSAPTQHPATHPPTSPPTQPRPGIEEIGVSIEEPHSILPLESICDTALRNVQELQVRAAGGLVHAGGCALELLVFWGGALAFLGGSHQGPGV